MQQKWMSSIHSKQTKEQILVVLAVQVIQLHRTLEQFPDLPWPVSWLWPSLASSHGWRIVIAMVYIFLAVVVSHHKVLLYSHCQLPLISHDESQCLTINEQSNKHYGLLSPMVCPLSLCLPSATTLPNRSTIWKWKIFPKGTHYWPSVNQVQPVMMIYHC